MSKLRVQKSERIIKVRESRLISVDSPRTLIIKKEGQKQVKIRPQVKQFKITTRRLVRQDKKKVFKIGAQQGAPGRDGVGANYTHTQSAPSSLWVIRHNLGRNPGVTIIQNGVEVETAVRYIDLNRVEIMFLTPETGEAYFI